MQAGLHFCRSMVFNLLVLCSHFYGFAQNAISISVKGIEYDDPNLILLKENLQQTKNVSSVKTEYNQGIAKIGIHYNSTAQNLWSEVPSTTKQFFKVVTINDNTIVLENRNAVQQSAASPGNSTVTRPDDDCKNCYFNLCSYDGTKSFQGKLFKQINKDDGTYYYNCDNGVVVQKVIFKNAYGQTTTITNDTIIMSNVPVGTTWGVNQNGVDLLGLKNINYHKYTLVQKHVSVTVNGTIYNNVLVVNYYTHSYDNLFGHDEHTSTNLYYAKGVGLIKQEKADPNSIPAGNATVSTEKVPEMKGVIDKTIVGSWRVDNVSGLSITYKFNEDGTYQYYVGDQPSNNGTCNWRLDGDLLNCFCSGWKEVLRLGFQKKNDAATGKPALVIQFRGSVYRTYISQDGKAPW